MGQHGFAAPSLEAAETLIQEQEKQVLLRFNGMLSPLPGPASPSTTPPLSPAAAASTQGLLPYRLPATTGGHTSPNPYGRQSPLSTPVNAPPQVHLLPPSIASASPAAAVTSVTTPAPTGTVSPPTAPRPVPKKTPASALKPGGRKLLGKQAAPKQPDSRVIDIDVVSPKVAAERLYSDLGKLKEKLSANLNETYASLKLKAIELALEGKVSQLKDYHLLCSTIDGYFDYNRSA